VPLASAHAVHTHLDGKSLAHCSLPHDLGHAFVTLSLDAGANLRDVQNAAGHADPRTTRRYDRARYNLDRHPTYALAGLIG
jgi:site-specific recombinase XerD